MSAWGSIAVSHSRLRAKIWTSWQDRGRSDCADKGFRMLMKQEGRCQGRLLKQWHSSRTQHKPIRIKWVQDGGKVILWLDLDPHSASWMTHPEVPGQFQGTIKRLKSGLRPSSWNLHSFPKTVRIRLPLSIWNYPAIKTNHPISRDHTHPLWWPTLCGVYLYLNKYTSYLSLGLSLIFFSAMRHQESELH